MEVIQHSRGYSSEGIGRHSPGTGDREEGRCILTQKSNVEGAIPVFSVVTC